MFDIRFLYLLFLIFFASDIIFADDLIVSPEYAKQMVENSIKEFGERYSRGKEYLQRFEYLTAQLKNNPKDDDLIKEFNLLFHTASIGYDNGIVPVNTPESAKRMIEDLIKSFGNKYPKGNEYLRKITELTEKLKSYPNDIELQKEFDVLLRKAALANPLLDFDKILLVRRNTAKDNFGFITLGSHTNETIKRDGWDNEIAILSDLRTAPKLTPVYKHPNGAPIRDLDLHFDGKKIMFSSVNENKRFAIYEVDIDGQNLRELTPKGLNDVDWFDSCYLPEENVFITASTAGMQGLPCEDGRKAMVNLYRVATGKKNQDGSFAPPQVRQLTFEQDSDWHPSIMHDGRVMYLRWEYSDIPHYTSRILFSMQPDGRNQRAIWGSGSYFPTAYKNPRMIAGHPSMVIGVLSCHHADEGGLPESGRLLLIDPNIATKYPFDYTPPSKYWGKAFEHINLVPKIYPKEKTGCVQEIPGYGRNVIGNVYDNQGGRGKYRFAYPYPLNENYFLVSVQIAGKGNFDLYLVDRWDNMIKLFGVPDNSFFHSIPLVPRERPPVRYDMTDKSKNTGTIFISDVYFGGGLKGVPRGKAKSLRIFSYHFGYRGSGGHESVGQNSSWDIKRILGTVPIEEDGSAMFNVPANTPISIQVLDENGAAIQLMRSWTVCMPGEQQSCIGCHETPLDVSPSKINAIAGRRAPREITNWYGEPRPFGYETEIQPLLDKNCTTCHNDETAKSHNIPSFIAKNTGSWRRDTSYSALNPYVWRPGPESDLEMLVPFDFHASVSELVQRLSRNHYGVKFEGELRDRIYTWIDLNTPYRGMWNNKKFEPRRLELQKLYAGIDTNPEEEYRNAIKNIDTKNIDKNNTDKIDEIKKFTPDDLTDWLKKYHEKNNSTTNNSTTNNSTTKKSIVKKESQESTTTNSMEIKLDKNVKIKFVRIPAGEFVMGNSEGISDERNRILVKIESGFWIAESELTNRQYAVFNAEHDTRYLHEDGKNQVVPGYIANHPDQPVARISFEDAEKFCEWLSSKSGKNATLPTEAQWEWAAKAGTDKAFWYGDKNTNFSKYANLAGEEIRRTRTQWDGKGSALHIRHLYPEKQTYPLRDNRWEDKWVVVDYVKQYEPNAWGLYDVIGNVWEWTIPDEKITPKNKAVARGGSWKDRPNFAGATARVIYEPFQKVMNVGFRPIIIDKIDKK
ncbi:MAG: SUMF1/EgtB/PvdO family nonheme iron enzyme [Planctomycetaceae bacterium]|jgi:formylglycine-generating enzyme required for sulfatase activity|nr:SUMF1/EgtB/PvdO family nonheme iron enzyme [Planctomycetaceae bacterium]